MDTPDSGESTASSPPSSLSAPVRENIPLQTLRKQDNHNVPMSIQDPRFNETNTQDTPESASESDLDLDVDSDVFSNTSLRFFQPTSRKDRFVQFLRLLIAGPSSPTDEPPKPIRLLQFLEDIPRKFRRLILPKLRVSVLLVYLSLWFLLVHQSLHGYLTVPPSYSNDPNASPILTLGCGSDLLFWKGKNYKCGLNGEGCPSMTDLNEDVIIRCPALCERESYTFSFLPVGNQRIKYRGYYIGGGRSEDGKHNKNSEFPHQMSFPYRADSFPCGAAVHAGVVSSYFGGCARVSFSSRARGSFPGTKAHSKGYPSIGFLSYFPSSFFFKKLQFQDEHQHFHQCKDPRFVVLAINILLGIPIVFLASGAVMYWTLSIVGFWTICMATDPPIIVDAADSESLAELVSLGLGRFLPTCCILYVLWRFSVKRTLEPPKEDSEISEQLGQSQPEQEACVASPLHRLILWYPVFWIGILNNLTFDRLPIDRFTLHDLGQQPGSMLAALSIVTLVAVSLAIQAYHVWRSGRLIKTLVVYVCFIIGLALIASLPGLTLRIHHYILAMLLIPGCSTRGRTALLFLGLLLGLFISGASRWGLDSIAETTRVLLRDDPIGTIEAPLITAFDRVTGMLSWKSSTSPSTVKYQDYYDGIALMVNDIEAYVGPNVGTLNLTAILTDNSFYSDMLALSANDSTALDAYSDVLSYLRLGLTILSEDLQVSAKTIGLPLWSDFSGAAIVKMPSGALTFAAPGLT